MPAISVVVVVIALVWLLFLALLAVAGTQLLAAGTQAISNYPSGSTIAALAAGTGAAVATASAALGLFPVRLGHQRLRSKLASTTGVLVLAGTLWTMRFWNMVGVRV